MTRKASGARSPQTIFIMAFDTLKKSVALHKKIFSIGFWLVVWQVAAAVFGYGGLLLPGPIQTLTTLLRLVFTAGFWRRTMFSTARILLGFLLATSAGTVLGIASARWQTVRLLAQPPLQLLRAMPLASFVILALLWVNSAWLSVVVSFMQVLPLIYAGVTTGIGNTDPELLEMACVFRLSTWQKLRYIWLPAVSPAFRESLSLAMGVCWKSGVSAEVIGLPDWSIGDALYRAKITLSTPEVFAWTLAIILISAFLTAMARQILSTVERYLCKESPYDCD